MAPTTTGRRSEAGERLGWRGRVANDGADADADAAVVVVVRGFGTRTGRTGTWEAIFSDAANAGGGCV
jgi:hypothetical protein